MWGLRVRGFRAEARDQGAPGFRALGSRALGSSAQRLAAWMARAGNSILLDIPERTLALGYLNPKPCIIWLVL